MSQFNNNTDVDNIIGRLYHINELPKHITESTHFETWQNLLTSEQYFYIKDELFVRDLTIRSQADFDKIIEADFVFGFNQDARKEILKNMIKLANLTRSGFENGDISILMSPRTVISWAQNYKIFKDNLLEMGYTNGVIDDEIQAYLTTDFGYEKFGKGVDFMEGVTKWHYRAPTSEELEFATKQLSGNK